MPIDFFIEYQNWGMNALTVSFLVSIVLTIISGWGLAQQNKTIWQGKLAEAVSVIWMTYCAFLQLAILVYGISIQSAALVFNGLLVLLYVPILIGLEKFKGFTTREKILTLTFLAMLVVMIVLPYKAWFFFAFGFGSLLLACLQPMEMWRKKSAAGLNIKLIGIFIFGNVIWFIYGLAVGDWVLIIINAIAFVIFGAVIFL